MRIGIIGGGQLGLMMAEAAHHLNHFVVGLDPNKDCSLSYEADEMLVAEYNDNKIVQLLSEKVDVITYEFENVDLDLIEHYLHCIPQKSNALALSRNRFIEKSFAQNLGIPIVQFELLKDVEQITYPSIIKTTTGGYDGKGQVKILIDEDIEKFHFQPNTEYIIERFFDFDYEISVISTRSLTGEVVHFPIPKNTHKNGILYTCEITDEISQSIQKQAQKYSQQIIDSTDYVGTMAVEYFVKEGVVYFNEFAPRPHNSGHYTIEGCNVSQFENHIRAITNMKLIEPILLQPTCMINVLGHQRFLVDRMTFDICFYHDYYKNSSLVNRKIGHITCISSDEKILKNTVDYIIGDSNE